MQNLMGKMFTRLATCSHCKVWKLKHCLVIAVASHWTDKRISRRDRHSFLYARHVPRKELPYNTVSSCKHNAIPIFEQELKKKRSISGYFFPCRFFKIIFSFYLRSVFIRRLLSWKSLAALFISLQADFMGLSLFLGFWGVEGKKANFLQVFQIWSQIAIGVPTLRSCFALKVVNSSSSGTSISTTATDHQYYQPCCYF